MPLRLQCNLVSHMFCFILLKVQVMRKVGGKYIVAFLTSAYISEYYEMKCHFMYSVPERDSSDKSKA